MSAQILLDKIHSGAYDTAFAALYGEAQVLAQRARYAATVEGFVNTFGDEGDLYLFSAPGRTEIGGNHTDHNYGRVLAGSVNLDVIAVVRPTNGGLRMQSEGYPISEVDISELLPVESEKNGSASLIRGTAARFADLDYAIGGFDAYATSNVLKGNGLSSSAAFEVLIGVIL
ncbi:MAG: galactokinase, partial [Clostridia bacterium]|nr:galactokinase [Clostridia bacterium]